MQQQVIHIHPDAPVKPAWGAPCNGCGLCCLAEPCPLGQLVSRKRHGACGALRWDGAAGLYRCGMVTEPRRMLPWLPGFVEPWMRRLARRWISAAKGCDAHVDRVG